MVENIIITYIIHIIIIVDNIIITYIIHVIVMVENIIITYIIHIINRVEKFIITIHRLNALVYSRSGLLQRKVATQVKIPICTS